MIARIFSRPQILDSCPDGPLQAGGQHGVGASEASIRPGSVHVDTVPIPGSHKARASRRVLDGPSSLATTCTLTASISMPG